MLRILSTLFATIALTGCSVWQNASRKYMEKQSYDFAGLKLQEQNFLGCGRPAESSSWRPGPSDARARVSEREVDGRFELRVEPAFDQALTCDYGFSSPQDRAAAAGDAIQHTLDQFDAP